MSRFSTTNTKGEKFVYGFDRPLQEYFLQKQGEDDWVELVGTLSTIPGTNGNLLEVADRLEVIIPEEHRDRIAFDFPI